MGEQVMATLHRAHSLFGDPSFSGGPGAVAAGVLVSGARDVLGSAESHVSATMSGQFTNTYAQRVAVTGRALSDVAETDGVLSSYLDAAAVANRSGREASADIVRGAAADIERLAPFSKTPSGERALLGAMRNRLAHHQAIVRDHQQQSAQFANGVRLLDFAPASPVDGDVPGVPGDPAEPAQSGGPGIQMVDNDSAPPPTPPGLPSPLRDFVEQAQGKQPVPVPRQPLSEIEHRQLVAELRQQIQQAHLQGEVAEKLRSLNDCTDADFLWRVAGVIGGLEAAVVSAPAVLTPPGAIGVIGGLAAAGSAYNEAEKCWE